MQIRANACAVVEADLVLVEEALHYLLRVPQELCLEVLAIDISIDVFVSDIGAELAMEARLRTERRIEHPTVDAYEEEDDAEEFGVASRLIQIILNFLVHHLSLLNFK